MLPVGKSTSMLKKINNITSQHYKKSEILKHGNE